jgi:prepilin-type N-terminal cleavage/methylation domain-containing protein
MIQARTKLIRQRRGFTLIEMLVVIAIIAVLASLASVAAFMMIGRRQASNTQATIRVVNKMMQNRWSAVAASAKKESPSPAALSMAGGNPQRAQVIWIKLRLMEAFPMSYTEISNPWVYSNDSNGNAYIPTSSQRRYIIKYQSLLASGNLAANNAATQSSACLLMALKTHGADGGVSVQDQLNYAVADSDNDGIPEFIDSWSNPLVFVRFGTAANVQAANPAVSGSRAFKHSDPFDPEGALLSSNWYMPAGNSLRAAFENNIHVIARDTVPNASFTIPVIASAGPDGIINNADDIYSFNLKGD